MADFPRIELSRIGWDVDPAREAITVDLTGHIQERINRLYRIITKAEDDKLKSLFEDAFKSGVDYGSYDATPETADFEQWWSELLDSLRRELDQG